MRVRHKVDRADQYRNRRLDETRAMRASGAKTKREAVETALRLMVSIKQQERIRRLRGKVKWEGDLMRCGATERRYRDPGR